MGKKPKRKGGSKPPVQKSRKEIRKDQRKEKKLKRSLGNAWKTLQTDTTKDLKSATSKKINSNGPAQPKQTPANVDNAEEIRSREKNMQKKLQSEMANSRKKQLLAANDEEDRNIRQLEKLLNLKRRKSKSLPKCFADDGLGYLLEVCDPEKMKDSVKVDQALQDSGSEFEEDLAIVRGKQKKKEEKKTKVRSKRQEEKEKLDENDDMDFDDDSGSDFGLGADDSSDEEMVLGEHESDSEEVDDEENEEEYMSDDEDEEEGNAEVSEDENVSEEDSSDNNDEDDSLSSGGENESDDNSFSLKSKAQVKNSVNKKKVTFKESSGPDPTGMNVGSKSAHKSEDVPEDEDSNGYDGSDNLDSDDDTNEKFDDNRAKSNGSNKNPDGTWQDIYGRTRDKVGNVIDEKPGKYIPPALRAKMQGNEDAKRRENLARLRRQMKGLINRLAENNMASICSEMDELFMKNSRNDMNETLLSLLMDVLVSRVLTPERLVMEHMLLIAVLHANVGSEVGATFLQNVMKKFEEMLEQSPAVENKELDNVVLILSHLYNFKIFCASLMYEVLDRISEKLDEKRIELLLVVLRSVGFSLRKDDPLALKSLILKLQGKATNLPSASSSSSRVKFMLDILMAVKNNNMSKIPSYNPEQVEHLKKLLRTLVRRGNYVAELKITLEDLLNADERGRWWIVGSAWTGHLPGENPSANASSLPKDSVKSTQASYSTQLLELAKKQRMNTGVRRDIFCILMTAEDYLDAFEKLLHLNLKNQQRQEIVHVLFDCCLQEKAFNPYYAHLSQKFCDFERQYQMKFQYCLWDKFKELDRLNTNQLSNMAKLVAHLFLGKGLPLSALKVISFAEMDKPCVRLVRQILLVILLSDDLPKCEAVFQRIAPSAQLHLFREGLRIFINHFVLRKSSNKSLPEKELELLHSRAKIAVRALSSADSRMEF